MSENEEINKIILEAFINALSKIDFSKIYKDQAEILDLTVMFKGKDIPQVTQKEAAFIFAASKMYFFATIDAVTSLKRSGIL